MSPATDNFIHSLVEMSKAFETLPQVQAALDQAKSDLNHTLDTVARREESIAKLNQEIEALHTRNRELEVQRDDAEYRFLEAEERTSKALDFIKTSFGSAGALIQSLEPPKPMPEPEPTPEYKADGDYGTSSIGAQVASELHHELSESMPVVIPETPFPSLEVTHDPAFAPVSPPPSTPSPTGEGVSVTQDPTGAPTQPYIAAPVVSFGVSSAESTSIEDQCEPGPTVPTTDYTSVSSQSGLSSITEPATTQADATSPSSPGLYHGKLYARVDGFISRWDWKAGGGTDATYDWRDHDPLPEGIVAA